MAARDIAIALIQQIEYDYEISPTPYMKALIKDLATQIWTETNEEDDTTEPLDDLSDLTDDEEVPAGDMDDYTDEE